MKKIISIMAFLVLSTVSAKAISMPNMPGLGFIEIKGGLAQNHGVFYATGHEKEFGEDGTAGDVETTKASGLFEQGFTSQFIEVGITKWIAVGYEHTADPLSTPTNVSNEGTANENSVSVDFHDLDSSYIKVRVPFMGGLYLKGGEVEVNLDIKEVTGSGNQYPNRTTSGDIYGAGYEAQIADTPLGIRIETAYMDLDPVSTNNGVATDGNHNRIDVNSMEGVTAKVALTLTLGRNK
jgi:hypothetical protein